MFAIGARAQQQLCRSPGAGAKYRSISAGARAAAVCSVMLRAEVRGSAQALISFLMQHCTDDSH